MNEDSLARLGDQGFEAIPANRLADVAAWCAHWCEETGDGRYCVLAGTLDYIADWWLDNDEHHNGVPRELVLRIERVLQAGIPVVIRAEDPGAGVQSARRMHEDVVRLIASIKVS